ncbi:MAG: DUF2279 domain-containing protein [Bacteroidota bacterium]
MKKRLLPYLLAVVCLFQVCEVFGQEKISFFTPVDTFSKSRFWGLTGSAAAGYTGVVIGLNELWYAQFDRRNFHFFNDGAEWKDMDKMGHLFTAYFQSKWAMHAYRWAGLNRRASVWAGVAAGTLFQSTLEVMDGFSSEWGFSFYDVAFNTAGVTLMASQEWLWQEQRIILKMSAHRPNYSTSPLVAYNSEATTTLDARAAELYGTNFAEVAIKDYNGLTVWASANISSFIRKKDTWVPDWLNIAIGYGAENLYGGFSNAWDDDDGNIFIARTSQYPRYRQYYLGFDVDFTRIKTRHRSLKFLFTLLNVVKVPSPTLEVNTLGKVKFHPLYF